MSENDHANPPDPVAPTAAAIRQLVDGELAVDAADALRRRAEQDTVLGARIRFEEVLRDRVARTMEAQAPEELDGSVRAALRDDDTPVAPVKSWLTGPTRATPLALAATIALVAGAILFGIFGPSIDQVQLAPVDVIGSTATFASREHGRCAGNPLMRLQKGRWQDSNEAAQLVAAHLGVERVPEFDLSSVGYVFVGAGECEMPFAERHSAHVIFKRPPTDERAGAMVSIFIALDEGQYDWSALSEEIRWGEAEANEQCTHQVLHLRNSRLVYFLVCCAADDQLAVQAVVAEQVRRNVR